MEKDADIMKRRFWNLDALRFVFAVLIVYYHVVGGYIQPFVGGDAYYLQMAANSRKMCMVAHIFFVISGFFLLKSIKRLLGGGYSFADFSRDKIFRLWPVMFLSLLTMYLVHKISWPVLFLNSFFLQCIGVSFLYRGLLWWVSCLFWALIFWAGLAAVIRDLRRFNLIGGIIVYFCIVLNMQNANESFGRDVIWGGVCLGLLSAIGLVGIGVFLSQLLQNCARDTWRKWDIVTIARRVIWTIIEIWTIYLLYLDFCVKGAFKNQLICIIAFCLLLVSFVRRSGLVGFITDNKMCGYCGRFGYSIYVFQQVVFFYLGKYCWDSWTKSMGFWSYISLSVLCSVTIGIIVYYVVEVPGAGVCRKIGRLLFGENTKSGCP